MEKLFINKELEFDFLPRLTGNERKELKKDIQENGQKIKGIIALDGSIIDGRNRVEICKELGIDFKYEVDESLNTLEKQKIAVITLNLLRRHLTEKQELLAIAELSKLYEIGRGGDRGNQYTGGKDLKIESLPNVIKTTSKKIGKSMYKINKARELDKAIKENPDLKEKNISQILRVAKERKIKQKLKQTKEEDLTDDQLLLKYRIKKQLYNIWNFQKKDERFGDTKFGFMPPEIMFNLLYYYTKQGDKIFDPFAGGGVSIDVCKAMNRTCLAYDIKPIRKDIKQHDITKGLPIDLKDVQLTFFDPAYWLQAKGKYTNEATDFSNMELEEFYKQFDILFKKLKNSMKEESYIALIIQGTQWKNDLKLEDHAIQLYKLLDNSGFKFIQRIIVPYSTQQYNAQQVNIAKEKKIILTIYRDLLVFQKKDEK